MKFCAFFFANDRIVSDNTSFKMASLIVAYFSCKGHVLSSLQLFELKPQSVIMLVP